jgi:hypothetical protein
MKRTKKTDKKLMFKQDEHHLVLEKQSDGIHIDIGDIEADDHLFTISNVLSIVAWVHDLEPDKDMKKALGK